MNNLGEESFALGMEIRRDKRKGVSGLSQRAYLEKSSKNIYSMHVSKPTHILLSRVIVLKFLGFPEPLYDRSKEKVPYASAVGSKICAQKNLP